MPSSRLRYGWACRRGDSPSLEHGTPCRMVFSKEDFVLGRGPAHYEPVFLSTALVTIDEIRYIPDKFGQVVVLCCAVAHRF